MCDRCEWKETEEQIKIGIEKGQGKLREGQQEWLERISITVSDDKHATDRQKAVARRILKEAKVDHWRKIPKASDRKTWSAEKKDRMKKRRKENRDYRRYGGF